MKELRYLLTVVFVTFVAGCVSGQSTNNNLNAQLNGQNSASNMSSGSHEKINAALYGPANNYKFAYYHKLWTPKEEMYEPVRLDAEVLEKMINMTGWVQPKDVSYMISRIQKIPSYKESAAFFDQKGSVLQGSIVVWFSRRNNQVDLEKVVYFRRYCMPSISKGRVDKVEFNLEGKVSSYITSGAEDSCW